MKPTRQQRNPPPAPPLEGRRSSDVGVQLPSWEGLGVGFPRSESAFTMVEIAISLAIIGFALVAIIGVLPIGMNVQRENREETIINQDAAVWFDAIRNGARDLYDLTNRG